MTAALTLHATAVALGGAGLLIRGAPGRGKSGLALEMMARGASLVSDDRTCLTRDGDTIVLTAPPAISGLIEARGLGLLYARTVPQARLAAVLDLDTTETERLPPMRETDLCGLRVPLLHNVVSAYFPAGLVQYLKAGRKQVSS